MESRQLHGGEQEVSLCPANKKICDQLSVSVSLIGIMKNFWVGAKLRIIGGSCGRGQWYSGNRGELEDFNVLQHSIVIYNNNQCFYLLIIFKSVSLSIKNGIQCVLTHRPSRNITVHLLCACFKHRKITICATIAELVLRDPRLPPH